MVLDPAPVASRQGEERQKQAQSKDLVGLMGTDGVQTSFLDLLAQLTKGQLVVLQILRRSLFASYRQGQEAMQDGQ